MRERGRISVPRERYPQSRRNAANPVAPNNNTQLSIDVNKWYTANRHTRGFKQTPLISSGASRLRLVSNHGPSGKLNWSSDCPTLREDLGNMVVL